MISFVLKRFCPRPDALKGELGNTPSKWGYGALLTMKFKSISSCVDDRFEGSISGSDKPLNWDAFVVHVVLGSRKAS